MAQGVLHSAVRLGLRTCTRRRRSRHVAQWKHISGRRVGAQEVRRDVHEPKGGERVLGRQMRVTALCGWIGRVVVDAAATNEALHTKPRIPWKSALCLGAQKHACLRAPTHVHAHAHAHGHAHAHVHIHTHHKPTNGCTAPSPYHKNHPPGAARWQPGSLSSPSTNVAPLTGPTHTRHPTSRDMRSAAISPNRYTWQCPRKRTPLPTLPAITLHRNAQLPNASTPTHLVRCDGKLAVCRPVHKRGPPHRPHAHAAPHQPRHAQSWHLPKQVHFAVFEA